jgi:hypothetical protein
MQFAQIWKYMALISKCPETKALQNSSCTNPSFGWALVLLRKIKESETTPVDARAVKGARVAVGVLVARGRDKPFIQHDTLTVAAEGSGSLIEITDRRTRSSSFLVLPCRGGTAVTESQHDTVRDYPVGWKDSAMPLLDIRHTRGR